MASGHMSRVEALSCTDCRHACHVMLYCDTNTKLFGRIPIRHIILMHMRFDGLLGFPGGLVNPSKETLEEGLCREVLEELGMDVPISVEDHVSSCYAQTPVPSPLIAHFYVKKLEEEQILEAERAAVSKAADHGQEVLGMVRVPLYSIRGTTGLPYFLAHAFIGNARTQLVDALLRFGLVPPDLVHKALRQSLEMHKQNGKDLWAALELTKTKGKRP